MRVLVIEDDRSVRETLGMVLESYNYEVTLVEGGEEALKYLHENWPDIMLLDLSLNGMSGEEIYFKIQSTYGIVPPTIVLSAVTHGESRIRNMSGARYLAKPYTLEQLIGLMQEIYESLHAA